MGGISQDLDVLLGQIVIGDYGIEDWKMTLEEISVTILALEGWWG